MTPVTINPMLLSSVLCSVTILLGGSASSRWRGQHCLAGGMEKNGGGGQKGGESRRLLLAGRQPRKSPSCLREEISSDWAERGRRSRLGLLHSHRDRAARRQTPGGYLHVRRHFALRGASQAGRRARSDHGRIYFA